MRALLSLLASVLAGIALRVDAAQIDITGPSGSVEFGTHIAVLPNGNIVVTDPSAALPLPNAGALHVYSPSGNRISTVTGSSANDQVGIGGIVVLPGGDYLILSPIWNAGVILDAGAVTFVDGNSDITGVVSAANVLVGASPSDQVGSGGGGVFVLSNGNYVVVSPLWSHDGSGDVGAVTWGIGKCRHRGRGLGFQFPDRRAGLVDEVTSSTSVLVTVVGGTAGGRLPFDYDPAREQMAGGRPASNIVSLLTFTTQTIFADGFE